MVRFTESETARNLLTAFSAETQARARYNFFADRAREENFIKAARIFDQTAEQEQEHALRFFKFFNGGEYEIRWPFPAGVIEDTPANLRSSAGLERYVHTEMYPGFAKIALAEGFQRAAETLDSISVAERHHELIFSELADKIEKDRFFRRDREPIWRCMQCGYLHTGHSAPDSCPACVNPAGSFEIYCGSL